MEPLGNAVAGETNQAPTSSQSRISSHARSATARLPGLSRERLDLVTDVGDLKAQVTQSRVIIGTAP